MRTVGAVRPVGTMRALDPDRRHATLPQAMISQRSRLIHRRSIGSVTAICRYGNFSRDFHAQPWNSAKKGVRDSALPERGIVRHAI
jgi:hypothetical protein